MHWVRTSFVNEKRYKHKDAQLFKGSFFEIDKIFRAE